MVDSTFHTFLTRVGETDCQARTFEAVGVLPAIRTAEGDLWVTKSQHMRVESLAASPFRWDTGSQLPDTLFVPDIAMALGSQTCLVHTPRRSDPGFEDFWIQLLPLWVDQAALLRSTNVAGWREIDAGPYRAYTVLPELADRVKASRSMHHRLEASRTAAFARSASYMGSKATLAGQLLDVLDAVEPRASVVLDLMCGSGAMSGALANRYRTIASDAQGFSRLLALVQGGGMSVARAEANAKEVMSKARRHYEALPEDVQKRIASEDRWLHSELTDSLRAEFQEDLQRRASDWASEDLGSLASVSAAARRGTLFSHLYAGLYFGDRQAAELDCLRRAIESVENDLDRQWALGALICAASSCAFTYGGHFAQPKLDIGPEGTRRGNIEDAIRQRTLSVTHELYVRLTSLAEESQACPHPIELVAGPWETAIAEAAARTSGERVCVYVDPPYTRDEYSRYYHVLESLVRYEPQAVSGKGRLPARATAGRFASALSGRRPERIEEEIAKVLRECLDRGWSCLWSYSDSGTASIEGTLKHLAGRTSRAELFYMNHRYKAQGKHGAKQVREYAVFLEPSGRSEPQVD